MAHLLSEPVTSILCSFIGCSLALAFREGVLALIKPEKTTKDKTDLPRIDYKKTKRDDTKLREQKLCRGMRFADYMLGEKALVDKHRQAASSEDSTPRHTPSDTDSAITGSESDDIAQLVPLPENNEPEVVRKRKNNKAGKNKSEEGLRRISYV
ncbi:hypothetical protein LTR64_007957 [Lithohypha guttulata]|uniref:Uncharacterized protein n=1 Tax=Lithohypha guttulata TaxID=1690604 RepID=A0AAN7SYX9_9EURO|nr:hypothetical protein LTR51_008174 [Lithohypha guttulata]KAK5084722.1 hypothetical protein LTR05_005800 [Lithohypha guttulata]